ncbi:MAG: acyltransferase [Bacteroidota bacterium]
MTNAAQVKTSSIPYFKGIDILRFICATGVIFHHTTSILSNKGYTTDAEFFHRNSGPFFLDVFFIISGFLISLILLKEHEIGTFSIKNFYARRIIRIWPLYFLIVIAKIIVIPLATEYVIWDIMKTNLIYACTFSVNFQLLFTLHPDTYSILWSICIEEHIYLLLPLFCLIFKNKFKWMGWFFIITGFISWMYFYGIPSTSGYNMPYFISISYFYFFGIGMIIAWFSKQNKKVKLLSLPPVQTILLIIIALYTFSVIPNTKNLFKILIIYAFSGGYLVWAATQNNFVIRFTTSLSKYLGNISYGMYVTHIIVVIPVIKYFKKGDFEFSELLFGWGIPLIATILTMALATLLYYFFERPILNFKKRFSTVSSK